jgi:regulator of extracellular matrix RemA (YlzA/DUF370 family)
LSDQKEKLLNLGHGNFILVSRLLAILSSDSSPMKRVKDGAKDRGALIDATQGRKTRSIVLVDSNHVFLSALTPETLSNRLSVNEGG